MSLLSDAFTGIAGAASNTFNNLANISIDRERQIAEEQKQKRLAQFSQGLADASYEKKSLADLNRQKEMSSINQRNLLERDVKQGEINLANEQAMQKQRSSDELTRMREEQNLIGQREINLFNLRNNPELQYEITKRTQDAMNDSAFQSEIGNLGEYLRNTYDPNSNMTIQEWVQEGMANYMKKKLNPGMSDSLKSKILTEANKSFDNLKTSDRATYDTLVTDAGEDEQKAREKYVGSMFAVSTRLAQDEGVTPKTRPTYEKVIADIESSADPKKEQMRFVKGLSSKYPELAQRVQDYVVKEKEQPKSSGGGLLRLFKGLDLSKGLNNLSNSLQ